MRKLGACLLLAALGAKAADLGTFGTTYDITESDARAWIMRMVSEMDASQLKERYEEQIENYDATLPQYETLTADIDRTRQVDMSITLSRDIIAPVPQEDGTVEEHYLGRKGQVINPLDHAAPREGLLFIDGSDEDQVRFMRAALEYDPLHLMPVLVKGRAFKQAEAIGRPVFHALPVMIDKLNIEHTPALARPDGKYVAVTEFAAPFSIESLRRVWVPPAESGKAQSCTSDSCTESSRLPPSPLR